jgi:hypothetical protein
MHYVTCRTHRMQKLMFVVTCSDARFMESASGPPKNEKYCIDVSWPRCTRMHYVTRRSHRIQKHKFGVVTCPDTLFVETAPGPPEHEK